MNITIATGPLLPIPPILGGAAQKIWLDLGLEFAKLGHKVTIVARAYKQQAALEDWNGITIIRSGGFNQSSSIIVDLVKDFFYAFRILSAIPKADILVCNDFWLPFFTQYCPQLGATIVAAGRMPKHQYRLYGKVKAVVAVSEAVKAAILRQSKQVSERTYVIGNPTATELFVPRTNQQEKADKISLLYVGRIHPEKGLDLLINSFQFAHKQNSQLELKIVGPWELEQGGAGETYLATLKATAKDLPVKFCDPVFEPQKLAEVYQQADVFCYPSLAEKGEAFGVAPLEAMSCGLPVIVSSLSCFKDFINEEEHGLVFDHNSEHRVQLLGEAILKMTQTPSLKETLGINARKQALNYSNNQIAQSYLHLFEKLV